MKMLLKTISYIGLALSVVPAVLVYRGELTADSYKLLMLLGMALWFGSALFWIRPVHGES
ncbi:MAG: hypothetical protein KDA44_13490 [Planctomycetales bacterium]|nr:hypothetical protein [Planctomycetales bacterium]